MGDLQSQIQTRSVLRHELLANSDSCGVRPIRYDGDESQPLERLLGVKPQQLALLTQVRVSNHERNGAHAHFVLVVTFG